jgi:hypothetical protein
MKLKKSLDSIVYYLQGQVGLDSSSDAFNLKNTEELIFHSTLFYVEIWNVLPTEHHKKDEYLMRELILCSSSVLVEPHLLFNRGYFTPYNL